MRNLWAFENAEGEFSDGPFQGYMEYQTIAPGVGLYRLEGGAERDYTLSAAEHSPEGMMIIGCMLSGAGRVAAKGSDDQIWQDDARLYAITPFGRRTNYHVTARKSWRSMALKIDANIINRVANDHVPQIVRQGITEGGAPMSTWRPMTPALLRAAEELSISIAMAGRGKRMARLSLSVAWDQTASIRGWLITETGAQAISVQPVSGDCRMAAR